MNLILFFYFAHRTWRIRYDKGLELTMRLWGKVSYNKATRILENQDLKIEQKQFSNLTQAEKTPKLKPDNDLTLFLATLDHEDFQVCVNNINQTNKADMIVFLKATS